MNFFILALLGYFLMILSKGEHLITINKSKTLLVIGVGLCLLSYILIFIKFIKEYNHIEMKNKISYGNLILFGVYVGQEYQGVPCVKSVTLSLLRLKSITRYFCL